MRDGWRQRELWGHLGWQDIKQRYRRSVLGPLWITITMARHGARARHPLLGAVRQRAREFLPYVTVGFIIWDFISGCIIEGTEVFIANEGLIKHLPAPISVHVYRLVWRQMLFFAHNLVVYVVMLIFFPQPLDWSEPAGDPRVRAARAQRAVGGAAVRHHQHPLPRHRRRSRRASSS